MLTRIQKWGNSLGLRIPRAFAREARVEEGSAVDLSVTHGQLIVRPVRQERYELNALLGEISDENLHAEIEVGPAQGREAW